MSLKFFVVCTFRCSSINKEISSSSRLSVIFSTSFSPKSAKFGKHSLFSLVEKLSSSAIFTTYVRLMVVLTLLKSGQTGLLGTRFGCYLYFADWSLIIISVQLTI